MTPQANLDRTDHEIDMSPATSFETTLPTERMESSAVAAPLPTQHEGPEMAWAGLILLGTCILLVGLGLWIAVAYNISIATILLGATLLVLIIVAVSNELDRSMPLPPR